MSHEDWEAVLKTSQQPQRVRQVAEGLPCTGVLAQCPAAACGCGSLPGLWLLQGALLLAPSSATVPPSAPWNSSLALHLTNFQT